MCSLSITRCAAVIIKYAAVHPCIANTDDGLPLLGAGGEARARGQQTA